MKRRLLSGNYETKKTAEAKEEPEKEEEEESFERAALARLGGSIAFIRGRKLVDEG